MVEEGQRDPEFETILDMVDPNRFVVLIFSHFLASLQSSCEQLFTVNFLPNAKLLWN